MSICLTLTTLPNEIQFIIFKSIDDDISLTCLHYTSKYLKSITITIIMLKNGIKPLLSLEEFKMDRKEKYALFLRKNGDIISDYEIDKRFLEVCNIIDCGMTIIQRKYREYYSNKIHDEKLKYILPRKANFCLEASKYGYINILEWAIKQQECPLHYKAYEEAEMNGQFKMILYFIKIGLIKKSAIWIRYACKNIKSLCVPDIYQAHYSPEEYCGGIMMLDLLIEKNKLVEFKRAIKQGCPYKKLQIYYNMCNIRKEMDIFLWLEKYHNKMIKKIQSSITNEEFKQYIYQLEPIKYIQKKPIETLF